MKKTVLVVEDDLSIASSLREFLEDNNFTCLHATNGVEALNILGADQVLPSLILLDLMMPVMDGFAFREKQLIDPRIKDIPVVVMSADGHVAQKKLRTTAVEYLKKPLDIFELLKIIEKFAA